MGGCQNVLYLANVHPHDNWGYYFQLMWYQILVDEYTTENNV